VTACCLGQSAAVTYYEEVDEISDFIKVKKKKELRNATLSGRFLLHGFDWLLSSFEECNS
jgi:hypothetical protein